MWAETPSAASTWQRAQTLLFCTSWSHYHTGQSRCHASSPRLYSLSKRLWKIKVIILNNYECVFKYQRMGTVMGCSEVPLFLFDGLTELLPFFSIVQGSAAATTSFSHPVHVQVHHLWIVFHRKIPSGFSLQQESFLDARCYPVFYGNYYINCISWKLIIPLLSRSGAFLLLLASKISYLPIMAFMMKFESSTLKLR